MWYLLQVKRNVLVSGETGVGKSVVVKSVTDDAFRANDYGVIGISFSARTSTDNLKDLLLDKLKSMGKRKLSCDPSHKCMIFFVDDINMPVKEFYGAQPPIELLRQTIETGF